MSRRVTVDGVRCRKCGVVRPTSEMPRKRIVPPRPNARNYQTVCRDCNNEISSAYGKANRAALRGKDIKHYRKWQGLAIAAYGGSCECCGETEPKFLEIDHVNGGGNAERRANRDIESFYRRLAQEKPDGYRVLCSNCNRGRWRNGGTCPHQAKAFEVTALEANPWYLQRFTSVM